MRGRRPAGLECMDELAGTPEDKERVKAVLDTVYGQARLPEACHRSGVGETRFRQLRQEALQGALNAIAPRPAGRPRRASPSEAERIRELEQALAQKELELQEARLRAEIALVLPRAVAAKPEPEKKTRRRRTKRPKWKPR